MLLATFIAVFALLLCTQLSLATISTSPTTPITPTAPVDSHSLFGLSGFSWSEILFNPTGNDNGREFIEIINIIADAPAGMLDGCSITDSSSTDTMVLRSTGGSEAQVSLILEDDSVWLSTADAMNATVYTIGSAIGNGLGNSYESLVMSCNGSEILRTTYNVSTVEGLSDGMSIRWSGSRWIAGVVGGTPGVQESSSSGADGDGAFGNVSVNGSIEQFGVEDSVPLDQDGLSRGCNASLAVFVAASPRAGGSLRFRIVSSTYASFTALSEGVPFASGDNLDGEQQELEVPLNATLLRITAFAEDCGSRLRSTKYVDVLPALNVSVNASAGAGRGVSIMGTPGSDQVVLSSADAAHLSSGGVSDGSRLLEEGAISPSSQSINSSVRGIALNGIGEMDDAVLSGTVLTGDVVATNGSRQETRYVALFDENIGVIAWVSAFGIVTIIVSAVLFFKIRD